MEWPEWVAGMGEPPPARGGHHQTQHRFCGIGGEVDGIFLSGEGLKTESVGRKEDGTRRRQKPIRLYWQPELETVALILKTIAQVKWGVGVPTS